MSNCDFKLRLKSILTLLIKLGILGQWNLGEGSFSHAAIKC